MRLCLLTILALVTSVGGQPRPVAVPDAADFPPSDAPVWTLQRTGLLAKAAARSLAERPDDPETITVLAEAGWIDDVLVVLRTIAQTRPERMARAFELAAREAHRFLNGSRPYRENLRQIADAAAKRLPELSRELQASLARQLLHLDLRLAESGVDRSGDQLKRFVQEYPGTEAAQQAQVDSIERGDSIPARLQDLERFARSHPGTVAGAKALFQYAWHLAVNASSSGIEKRGADPTERFLKVLDLAWELESGRYPRSEWTERAPIVVTSFFAYEATYTPGNVDRMLAGYHEFIRRHFVLNSEYPLRSGVGYVIADRMAKLFKEKGDGFSGLEQMMRGMEREVPDSAAAT
jgi:hypothetical protein